MTRKPDKLGRLEPTIAREGLMTESGVGALGAMPSKADGGGAK